MNFLGALSPDESLTLPPVDKLELDELLITLFELFTFCCGVFACGGVLGPCDLS